MSPEDALRTLAQFTVDAQHVNVLLVADGDDEPIIQRLSLHQRLADNFRATASESVPALEGNDRNHDVVLRSYEPGYKPEAHELLYVDLTETESIREKVADVGAVAQAGLFAEADEVVDRLRFYAIVVETGVKRRAVFFRGYSPKKELSRRPGFAAILKKGAYDALKQKVFLFDEQVDCFAWQQHLFIWNVSQFQNIFRYFDEVREKAAATIDTVTARVPISNVQVFKDSCIGNSMMAGKLAQIARKPYLDRITIDDIKATITEFALDIELVSEDGREKLVFDGSPAKRWLILKLLDDDYLGSRMTKQKYEVNSKITR